MLQGDCLGDIKYLGRNLRHSSLICGNPASIAVICSKFRCMGESWVHIITSVTANCQSHSAINTVYMLIAYLCQNMKHGWTYSGWRYSLRRNIIVVRTHLRSAFQCIRDWHTDRIFMAKLHLSLLGMSWPMMEVQAELRSAIQSRMTFLDFYDINFGKLQLIMNVSLQVRHAPTATISPWSACTPLHCELFIFVCFILIMFSSASSQWMLCTQVVISQDTADLGSDGSSRWPSANISIYAWSVC